MDINKLDISTYITDLQNWVKNKDRELFYIDCGAIKVPYAYDDKVAEFITEAIAYITTLDCVKLTY